MNGLYRNPLGPGCKDAWLWVFPVPSVTGTWRRLAVVVISERGTLGRLVDLGVSTMTLVSPLYSSRMEGKLVR